MEQTTTAKYRDVLIDLRKCLIQNRKLNIRRFLRSRNCDSKLYIVMLGSGIIKSGSFGHNWTSGKPDLEMAEFIRLKRNEMGRKEISYGDLPLYAAYLSKKRAKPKITFHRREKTDGEYIVQCKNVNCYRGIDRSTAAPCKGCDARGYVEENNTLSEEMLEEVLDKKVDDKVEKPYLKLVTRIFGFRIKIDFYKV